jgi:hypothetical protein
MLRDPPSGVLTNAYQTRRKMARINCGYDQSFLFFRRGVPVSLKRRKVFGENLRQYRKSRIRIRDLVADV